MNSESKDATVNLLLLVLFILSGTILFFCLISVCVFWNEGFAKIFSNGLISNSFLEKFNGKELNTIQLLSQVIGLILPAFLLSKTKKSVGSYLEIKPFNFEFALLAFGLFIFSYPLVSYLTYLNQLIPLPEWMSSKEDEMSALIKKLLTMNNVLDLVICITAIAVIPAIAEEWIFRGIIQNQLIRIVGNKWMGLVIASIIFSAIHMQFEGFLPRFALGIILGFVYLIGGSLKYSMSLHFIFNGFQVIAVYFNGINIETSDLKETIQTYSFYSILLFSFAIIFFLIKKILNYSSNTYV